MIWVKTEARVYVVSDDGKQPTWNYDADVYKDGQPATDPSISPPPGFLQPVRGFGLVWRTQNKRRQRLGWAIWTELAFAGAMQGDELLPGYRVYQNERWKTIQLSDRRGQLEADFTLIT